jgi:hypothetical protein
MDTSTKPGNATAQSKARIRLPRHVASPDDVVAAVIAAPPRLFRWPIQRWYTQHITVVGRPNNR